MDKQKHTRYKNYNWILHRYRRTKYRAIKKNINFNLSFKKFKEIAILPCHYCGGFFGNVKWSSGLDRIDNLKGYENKNCVSCCQVCNRVKGDIFTLEETKKMISIIVKDRKLNLK